MNYLIRPKKLAAVAITVGFVLLAYFILMPFFNEQRREILNQNSQPVISANQRLSLQQEQRTSYLTLAAAENEYVVDMTFYHIMNRNQQSNRQLPNLVIYTFAVLLVAFGIMIRKSRYHAGETDNHVNILAKLLGGHAPPVWCF